MNALSVSQGKGLLAAAFQEFISTGIFPAERYMAPEYEQWSDGEKLDHTAFVQYMSTRVKQGYSFDSFTVDETVTEGNRFVSRHRLRGKMPLGQPFTLLTLAIFEIQDGKFVRCWELSRMERGDQVD